MQGPGAVVGVALPELGDQFAGMVAGRTLLFDGDFALYAVSATVKTLPTAIRRYQQRVLEAIFLAKAQDASVHITSTQSWKNGRGYMLGAKPYQGNRTGKEKPALLEPLREAMARPENWLDDFTITLHRTLEADDGLMIEAYARQNNAVMRSGDKDLRLTPYLYYEEDTANVVQAENSGFGSIWEAFTEGGTLKGLGLGRKFAWLQMLMGDPADNVQGILSLNGKRCGPANALAALTDITDEDECANYVIEAYSKIDQNPLPEGHCLWLLRSHDDQFTKYLQQLKFSKTNQEFLMDCFSRRWYEFPADDPDA